MKHVESYDYSGRKADIYEANQEVLRAANRAYRVYVDGECISDSNPMAGPTIELLREDIKKWIDENPQVVKVEPVSDGEIEEAKA